MRAEIADAAVALFAERGFDETTVEDIARAVGMTKRSFFRYFPTKEDAVFAGTEVLVERVVDDLRARPADEPPWECLHQVLRRWQEEIHRSATALAHERLIESTPVLRARLHQKRELWRHAARDVLVERSAGALDDFAADLLANAAVAVLESVAAEWVRTDGRADRGELLDKGFATLRPRFPNATNGTFVGWHHSSGS
ncbi:TetR family transcriptional regulator [Pseudonocardia sp. MH-G8]|nr:TetR family transcriptional regulator [Pseudonocardia sp. MH-G8]